MTTTNNTQHWLAPAVVANSTVSGRSVEPLFLTLPARARNKGKTKIGFGVKSTHRFDEDSPYTFIGFDFSAQEMQVAGIFAQTYSGNNESGFDKLDNANLTGDKSRGTDVHSLTAKAAGVPRDIAKNVNYGLCFGSGLKTAIKTTEQGLSEQDKHQAAAFAKATLESFKGSSNRETGSYEGGLASNYFNYVYKKSAIGNSTLAIFNQPIPKCLDSKYIGKSGSPAQINCYVQSVCSSNGMLSAYVIFLYEEAKLMGLKQGEDFRYAISIHDEVWFICKDSLTKQLATCMVRAHAATWALLMSRLNPQIDLPVQRLFYDIVIDVTKCLRKEANQVIDTPDFKYSKLGYQYYVSKETGKLTRRNF